jgi:hypothetical protein
MSEKIVPIDCLKFEEILIDLDRPGTEGFALREGAFLHAESCGDCGLLLVRNESLDVALRAVSATGAKREASARVETLLMGEFRRKMAVAQRLRVKWQVAALSAAAVAVVSLGFSLHWFSLHPRMIATGNDAGKSLASAPTAVDSPGGEAVADSSTFIPLLYADDPAAVQDDAVVRVVLSPAALAALGLPVPDTDGSETVSADLKVSEDGTPQAIRLVSQESSGRYF